MSGQKNAVTKSNLLRLYYQTFGNDNYPTDIIASSDLKQDK